MARVTANYGDDIQTVHFNFGGYGVMVGGKLHAEWPEYVSGQFAAHHAALDLVQRNQRPSVFAQMKEWGRQRKRLRDIEQALTWVGG